MKSTESPREYVRGRCLLLVLALSTGSSLGLAERAWAQARSNYGEDLAAFFAEMDKTYPFFDLKRIRKDWEETKKRLARQIRKCESDREFIGLVLEAVRCLRDGHIGFAQVKAKTPEPEVQYYSGISLMPASKNRVVVMAAPRELSGKLKPGIVLTEIDGKPARKVLEAKAQEAWDRGGFFSSPQRARLFEYRLPLRGKRGEKHKYTFLVARKRRSLTLASTVAASGWPHTYNMPSDLAQYGRSTWYRQLDSGVGYIYLRRIDGDTAAAIGAALSKHPEAEGWIVDLRGNGGGGYSGDLIRKFGEIPGPVAVLIDAGCMSAGETVARDLIQQAQARVFGSTTAGASSAKRTWSFPSGIAMLIVPTRSRFGPDRRPIEYNGIKPHFEVEAEPEEVAKGLNSAILRAEEYLLRERAKTRVRRRRR